MSRILAPWQRPAGLVRCSIVTRGNSQSSWQKCAKFALEKISYLCWLHPQRLLLLVRLLGTGMQSICKFSLLCRVCKCSSIWLLSIFSFSVAGYRFHSQSCLPSSSILCYFYTRERIERCLSVWSGRRKALLSFVLALQARPPLGYANDAWLPLGSWRMRWLLFLLCVFAFACVFLFLFS